MSREIPIRDLLSEEKCLELEQWFEKLSFLCFSRDGDPRHEELFLDGVHTCVEPPANNATARRPACDADLKFWASELAALFVDLHMRTCTDYEAKLQAFADKEAREIERNRRGRCNLHVRQTA